MKERDQQNIFNEWLSQYRSLLFKVIKSYTGQQNDQDDLFQDICLQVYNSIPNFKNRSAVSTWLYRIALNTAIKWSTKHKRLTHLEQDNLQINVLKTSDNSESDRIEWLYQEIKKLHEIDRSLLLLLLEGYSYKEMADILGISESNIGVKIHRIKKELIKNSKKI